jgi:hypothetical protein
VLVVLGTLAVGVVCVERSVRRTVTVGKLRVRVTGTDRVEGCTRVGLGLSVRAGEVDTVETAGTRETVGTREDTEGTLGVTVRVGVRVTGDVTLDEVRDVIPEDRGTVVTERGETVRVVG